MRSRLSSGLQAGGWVRKREPKYAATDQEGAFYKQLLSALVGSTLVYGCNR